MAPIALSLGLFAFWSAVGIGIVTALAFSRNPVRIVLLAAPVGATATLLPIFWLSRLGWPVKVTAWPVAIFLILLSLFLYWTHRPRFPWKSFAPFAAILALVLPLTARPFFLYGFNWLSYANDDMANYSLSAERLLNFPYSARPDLQTYLANSDPSLHFWFFHVYLGTRTGADLLLAWLMAISGMPAIQVFMPLILAFQIMLIAATSALIYRNPSQRLGALLTALLLACSALISLGTLYQLIAQVWGLALLAAGMTVFMRPVGRMPRVRFLQASLLSALLIAALIVSYPEVLAFFVLSVAFFGAWSMLKSRSWKPLLMFYGCTAAFLLLLVNTYIPPALLFFTSQVFTGVGGGRQQSYLFPYYLLPSGLANLWGLAPINIQPPQPWLSGAIVAGALLLALAVLAAAWQAKAGHPVAMMTAVMLVLATQLFLHHSDFGLFKLAMFIQPFLIGTMVTAWLRFLQGWGLDWG